ncbi:MAG: hypothetical protein AAGK14_04540 [Verrucomicrobiota bacterium]
MRLCHCALAAVLLLVGACAHGGPSGGVDDSGMMEQQARRAGVYDYDGVVAKAASGDADAMHELFRITPQITGEPANEQSSNLVGVLGDVGDGRFAGALVKEDAVTREAVGDAIEGWIYRKSSGKTTQQVNAQFKKAFPRTWRAAFKGE